MRLPPPQPVLLAAALAVAAVVLGAGVIVFGDGTGTLELDTGATHVTVFGRHGRAVVDALRPVGGPQEVDARLPRPRYPAYYIDELRRVSATYARLGGVQAVHRSLRLSPSRVRVELALARGLSSARLRRVRSASPDLHEVQRDLLFAAIPSAVDDGDQPHLSAADIRTAQGRGRALLRGCELEPAH